MGELEFGKCSMCGQEARVDKKLAIEYNGCKYIVVLMQYICYYVQYGELRRMLI